MEKSGGRKSHATVPLTPEFNGKYISYPLFLIEWWVWRTYHGMMGDTLVAKNLKDKCIDVDVKLLVGNRGSS
jgi:hypothetical protein